MSFVRGIGVGKGTTIVVDTIYVYVTEPQTPTSSDKAVLFIHDGYGFADPHMRDLADSYAEQANVKVFLPDCINVALKPLNFDALTHKFSPTDRVDEREERTRVPIQIARALKDKHAIKKLAVVGIGWGSLGAITLLSSDLVEGGVVLVPSQITLTDFEGICKPTLFVCAGLSGYFKPHEQQQAEGVLAKKTLLCRFSVYPGAKHGFIFPGRFKKPSDVDKAAADNAKQETIEFLKQL